MQIGHSYCVEVNNGLPRPTSTLPGTTGTPKPSPTQAGLISTCTAFYKAVSGDGCSAIAAHFGTFTLADFIAWNPAVKSDCTGLWVDFYYCVGIPGNYHVSHATYPLSSAFSCSHPSRLKVQQQPRQYPSPLSRPPQLESPNPALRKRASSAPV
jgi:hypothetical protein